MTSGFFLMTNMRGHFITSASARVIGFGLSMKDHK